MNILSNNKISIKSIDNHQIKQTSDKCQLKDSYVLARVKSLNKNLQRTLFFLIQGQMRWGSIKVTQTTIGSFSQFGRDAGHNHVHELRKKKFISFNGNRSNVYAIHQYEVSHCFMTPHALFELLPYFSSIGLTRKTFNDFFAQRKSLRKNNLIHTATTTQSIKVICNISLVPILLVVDSIFYNRQSHIKKEKGTGFNQKQKERVVFSSTEKGMILDKLSRGEIVEWAPSIINGLQVIKLTDSGKAKLCAFSEEAIAYAIVNFKPTKATKNPFALFLGICKRYSEDNGIKIDWRHYYKLIEVLGIDANAPTHEAIIAPWASDAVTSNTISLQEGSQRNRIVRDRYSYNADNSNDTQIRSNDSCWSESLETMTTNLALLREISQTGNQFERDTASMGILAIEKVLAIRLSTGISTVPPISTKPKTGTSPERRKENLFTSSFSGSSSPLPVTSNPPPPLPINCCDPEQIDYLNEDLYEEVLN